MTNPDNTQLLLKSKWCDSRQAMTGIAYLRELIGTVADAIDAFGATGTAQQIKDRKIAFSARSPRKCVDE